MILELPIIVTDGQAVTALMWILATILTIYVGRWIVTTFL